MRKALVVGINDYPASPLYACVADAIRMAGLLARHEDGSANFDVSLQRHVQEKLVLKNLIRELFSGEGDTVVFYFSGHGMLSDAGGLIVTPDYRPGEEGITMDYILNLANRSSITNKVIILDCCHSGAMGTQHIINNRTSMLGNGVTILTASRDFEPAVERSGQGVFTKLVAEALEGGAADLSGCITPGGIYSYVDKSLGYWGQRPVFKTNISTFVSLRNAKPPMSPADLQSGFRHFRTADSVVALNPSFEFTSDDADPNNVAVFKQLQSLVKIGLVEPVDEEHMYFAAMRSKSCRLTRLGRYYWKLIADNRI